ncbi:MAG TPA: hypothetical protein VEZ16_13215 [Microvirga sp.]|nr:hypothetical protein [Microvirga sp.]
MTASCLPFRLVAAALVAALGACQTSGSGQQSAGTSSEPLRLPADFKQDVAVVLVTEYVKDGIGPATVSEVWNGQGMLGANTSVLIRYPVRDKGIFASSDSTKTRCIKVELERSIGTGGKEKFSVTRPRTDGEGCYAYEKTSPYVELERLAAKLRACKVKGEERCLLSTTMPEAQARKLMNMR